MTIPILLSPREKNLHLDQLINSCNLSTERPELNWVASLVQPLRLGKDVESWIGPSDEINQRKEIWNEIVFLGFFCFSFAGALQSTTKNFQATRSFTEIECISLNEFGFFRIFWTLHQFGVKCFDKFGPRWWELPQSEKVWWSTSVMWVGSWKECSH